MGDIFQYCVLMYIGMYCIKVWLDELIEKYYSFLQLYDHWKNKTNADG